MDGGQDIFSALSNVKPPEEEFNPFYFLEKIDCSLLKSEKSNPEWKLSINFNKYYKDFEKMILHQTETVSVLEKEMKEKTHN